MGAVGNLEVTGSISFTPSPACILANTYVNLCNCACAFLFHVHRQSTTLDTGVSVYIHVGRIRSEHAYGGISGPMTQPDRLRAGTELLRRGSPGPRRWLSL